MRCTIAASHKALSRCLIARPVTTAPPPQPRENRAPRARARKKNAGINAPFGQRRPFDQYIAHADRGMDRNRKHEQAIERRPGEAVARARKNIGRAHAVPRGIEDHGDMNENQRRHHGGGGALPKIEPHVHTLISPLR
jgi:hypothetical protein